MIIYHTPGHSPGHICIYDATNGYLFTGDLLYAQTPIYAFYPSTNPVDLVNSLEKISNIENINVISGSHNTLGLHPKILEEVKFAVKYLKEQKLTRFGTGIHKFKGFSIQF
ncbi:metallo-beta-lactamase superfamily protein [Priestia megaterium]|nr:MBL fold metallo-hydrolase [Priestia megaterium]KFM97065.1 metallo-beta-lactamase superfamily protein [Priestia megaterium]MED4396936.1 MBL fold metallo-hydrolase [Priestia megaterium]SUV19566.1 beta-lactamase [Priestia megaterium]